MTGLPVAGAEFTVSQNGSPISTAVSDANGIVYLGVLYAGTYLMRETVTPPGFMPNNTVYTVVVGTDGFITINGLPFYYFHVANTPMI